MLAIYFKEFHDHFGTKIDDSRYRPPDPWFTDSSSSTSSTPTDDGPFLQCALCHDRYNKPKVLPCLHTFCQGCLLQQTPKDSLSLTCPICRHQSILPRNGVLGLQDNVIVSNFVNLLEMPKTEELHPVVRVRNYSEKRTIELPPIEESAVEQKNHLKNLLLKVTSQIPTLKEDIQNIAVVVTQLKDNHLQTKSKMVNSLEDLENTLKSRKIELMEELDRFHQEKFDILQEQKHVLEMCLLNLEDHCQYTEDVLNRGSDEELNLLYYDLAEKLEDFVATDLQKQPKDNVFLICDNNSIEEVENKLKNLEVVKTCKASVGESSLKANQPEECKIGDSLSWTLIVRDRNGSPMTVENWAKKIELTDSFQEEFELKIVENENKSYSVYWTAVLKGSYRLTAKLFGHHVAGSPQFITCKGTEGKEVRFYDQHITEGPKSVSFKEVEDKETKLWGLHEIRNAQCQHIEESPKLVPLKGVEDKEIKHGQHIAESSKIVSFKEVEDKETKYGQYIAESPQIVSFKGVDDKETKLWGLHEIRSAQLLSNKGAEDKETKRYSKQEAESVELISRKETGEKERKCHINHTTGGSQSIPRKGLELKEVKCHVHQVTEGSQSIHGKGLELKEAKCHMHHVTEGSQSISRKGLELKEAKCHMHHATEGTQSIPSKGLELKEGEFHDEPASESPQPVCDEEEEDEAKDDDISSCENFDGQIDNDLIMKIGRRGRSKGEFTNLQGLCCTSEGRIIASDSNNQCVQVFDKNGKFLIRFGGRGRGPGQMQRPTGIAISPSGNYLVADYELRVVNIFKPDGQYCRRFGSGKLLAPRGLLFTRDGKLLVVDSKANCVYIMQENGKFLGKIGSPGCGKGRFSGPHYVALDSQDRVVVTDFHNHSVHIFLLDGSHVNTFGSKGEGNGQFNAPTGIAIDSQDNIIVADWGNNRIQIFDSNGSFLSFINTDTDPLYGPQDLALTPEGYIIVADSGSYCLKVYKYLQ